MLPGSGGTYRYLREGFGSERFGRLMAFLFIWQFILSGPLEIASGYIGFANYARYILPDLSRSGAIGLADAGRRRQHRAALPAHRLHRHADGHAVGRHAGDDAGGDRDRRLQLRPGHRVRRSAEGAFHFSTGLPLRPRRRGARRHLRLPRLLQHLLHRRRGARTRAASSRARSSSASLAVAVDLHRHQPVDHRRRPVARVRAQHRAPAVGLHRLDLHGADLRIERRDRVHAAGAVDGVRVGVRAAARLLAHPVCGGHRRHVLPGLRPKVHPEKHFPHVSLLLIGVIAIVASTLSLGHGDRRAHHDAHPRCSSWDRSSRWRCCAATARTWNGRSGSGCIRCRTWWRWPGGCSCSRRRARR